MIDAARSPALHVALAVATALTLAAALAGCAAKLENVSPRPQAVAAQRGLAYAQRRCATCHAIAAGEVSSPLPSAPSFDVVANTPGMTPTALHAWLRSPHQTMPQLEVPSNDLDDISAYLDTLARHGGRA